MSRVFSELLTEYESHYSSIQDIQQCMYGIQTCGDYHFICFFDQQQRQMNTTVADKHMIEIKLVNDLPVDIKVAFGAFNHAVLNWQKGIGEFPAQIPTEKQIQDLSHAQRTTARKAQEQQPSDIENEYELK